MIIAPYIRPDGTSGALGDFARIATPKIEDYNIVGTINKDPNSGKAETAVDALSSGDWKNVDYWLDNLYSRAQKGDDAAFEKLFNFYATEQSSKTARDWTSQREDSQYQRLMADLKKAGISPYILSGATPAVSSAASHSYSGSQMTTKSNADMNNVTGVLGAIMRMIGLLGLGVLRLAA